ncbi:MAG TPA: FAD-binding oxidoreductase [Kiritimatiellia bacterium]|nr:FAD-binding oxidoreductase [Kiritimatiellia bacterium]
MSRILKRQRSRVISLKPLSSTAYELTFERCGLDFHAGRLLTVHGTENTDDRSYTIASGEQDEHLQIIFRLIPSGRLTPGLARLKPGDEILFSGPFGEFTVRDPQAPLIFIATGTGVAPCRAYLRTFENLDLTLLHGVRVAEDLFYRDLFSRRRHFPCVSREAGTGFHGRVTKLLEDFDLPAGAHYYLCGANEMIFDAQVLLKNRGVDLANVFTEAYYYRLHS